MSPRLQNTKDPESLRSSVVRNVQRGKVIWCLEGQIENAIRVLRTQSGRR